ncbi:867_t:CDS:2 [Funneliformis mosseae]|uniref:867_t:CDS:1 n=1 Tax=Funneliformis mosseae TaxID=27381 RepID=A0A9N9DD12_FUNMO|nr:867_t:CDS:2 [Funneliformis mosseae]
MDVNEIETLPQPHCSFSSFNTKSTNKWPSSLNIIPCQQTININPIGKPIPNKRGRKPLTTMPSTKKHIQNLANQRAFRQRRDNYVKNLESKVLDLERQHSSAQNEIKNLRDEVEMLRKKLDSSRSTRNEAMKNADNRDSGTRYGGIVGSAMYQAIIEDSQNECDAIMNDVNQTPNGIYIHQPTISYNEQQPQYNQIKVVRQLNQLKENKLSLSYKRSKPGSFPNTSNSNSIESVDEIIHSPLFCDPKGSNICFSESINGDLGLSGAKISSQIPTIDSMGKYIFGQKTSISQRDNQSWIHQNHPYFNPPPTVTTTVGTSFTQHHPLNLKWILREEQNID